MNKIILRRSRIAVLLLSVFTLSFAGCKVQLISAYDDAIHTQITTASKDIDTFYTQMLATTTQGSAARQYSNFAANYATIEVELRQLYNINSTRAKNAQQDTICSLTLKQWLKYEAMHKGTGNGTLMDFQITLNRDFMLAKMQAMEVSERVKMLGASQASSSTNTNQ
ncbi:hypothetical protein BEL04_22135 [Mucilaginibacter sp. PPCGB 2223]|uniref:hypothetical protein n=1 Tax=Mucilaginibacter sp. PPCGB 2223 TaxID=1886027 RepID=UPI000824FEE1|nr:hypothetical protein [Mucilaginibacter sp. PPCGB 2223]OCX50483.1 hypothetical protein BEL04_22135 [Mucilaginibacter sp. PPCGB 2223]